MAARLGQALAHLRIGEGAVHFGVQLVDDFARRCLGYADAEPRGGLLAGHGVADGGQLGHGRFVFRRGDGEQAEQEHRGETENAYHGFFY